MRDVADQLAGYFDATVERITPEDVLAGSELRLPPEPTVRARVGRLRPAWALVAGFAATVVSIGSGLGIAILLEKKTDQVGTAVPPSTGAGGGGTMPWPALLVAGVLLGLLAAVLVATRARTNSVRTRREDMQQTLERPEIQVGRQPRVPWWLIGALAALLIAGTAFGTWLIVGDSDELTAAQQQMVAAYEEGLAAYNSSDLDGIRAQYSPDAAITFRAQLLDVDGYMSLLATVGIGMWEWTDAGTIVVDNTIVGVTVVTSENMPGTRWLTVFKYDVDTYEVVESRFIDIGPAWLETQLNVD